MRGPARGVRRTGSHDRALEPLAAFAFTFPLFLATRQRRLNARATDAASPAASDGPALSAG